ncbi:MAG: ribosomal protein S18-alanine N-acetyltransferase [candidate division Zixibacteria bacterium]|nr:ribosomal protein S18-alanine N-acetyltransferase [candidate division Zixibacteria bacterium]
MSSDGKIKTNSVIRLMKREDIDHLASLEMEIFSDPWPVEAFIDGLDDVNHVFLVVEIEKQIAGYGSYYIEMGEGRLTNIAITPEFRRKSIAKKLLEYILGVVKEAMCKYIFLDVRPTNEAAISLYNLYGFYEAYRRPEYYSDPTEDAMVMVKNLDDE